MGFLMDFCFNVLFLQSLLPLLLFSFLFDWRLFFVNLRNRWFGKKSPLILILFSSRFCFLFFPLDFCSHFSSSGFKRIFYWLSYVIILEKTGCVFWTLFLLLYQIYHCSVTNFMPFALGSMSVCDSALLLYNLISTKVLSCQSFQKLTCLSWVQACWIRFSYRNVFPPAEKYHKEGLT